MHHARRWDCHHHIDTPVVPAKKPCRPSTLRLHPSICCFSSFLLRRSSSLLLYPLKGQNSATQPSSPHVHARIFVRPAKTTAGASQTSLGFRDTARASGGTCSWTWRGEHTLALPPTGGGKSVLPTARTCSRRTLPCHHAPLIALMEDQCEGLRRKGCVQKRGWATTGIGCLTTSDLDKHNSSTSVQSA